MTSGELPQERWNPTQNVRTILMSVISLLNEPNTSSPANVDASVMFREWKESKNTRYKEYVLREVGVFHLFSRRFRLATLIKIVLVIRIFTY